MGAVPAMPYSRATSWRDPPRAGFTGVASHRRTAARPARHQQGAVEGPAGQGGCRPTEGTATCHQPTEGTATCRRPTEGSRSRRDPADSGWERSAAPCLHPAPGAAGFVLLNRRSRHTLSKTEMRVLAQPPGPRRFQKYAERYGRSDEISRSTKTSLVQELEGTAETQGTWAALCRCTGQLC